MNKTKSIAKRLISVVLLMATMASAIVLTGCASNSEDTVTEINLLSWAGISDEAIQKLQDLTGYTINYTPFSTLEEMQSKTLSTSTQYDVAMSSDYIIEALVAQDGLEEIDPSKISNYQYLGEGYLSPSYDPDDKWSVPYSGGGVGILVNRDAITTPITSYADLWDSSLADQIIFRDDLRIALSIANLVNGNDFNASEPDQIEAAGQMLEELLPNIHAFAYSGYKLMLKR